MSTHVDSGSSAEQLAITLAGSHWCIVSPQCFTEACFSVPAVRALRHHSAEASIAILCPRSQVMLWQYGLDELTSIIEYEEGASAKTIATLLEGFSVQFDSAVLWEVGNAAKATTKVGKTGIGQRVGYSVDELKPFLTDVAGVDLQPGPIQHRVRYYLGLVNQLGVDAFVRSSFEKPSLPAAAEQLKIGIAPFSEYGSSYQWPAERFLEVVAAIEARYPGVSWMLYDNVSKGAKKNLEVFEELLKQDNFSLSDSSGGDVFSSLAQSSALLACDGELAHVAAHVGLPATVIFGPNAPEWKRPLGKQSDVVREHVACSPCFAPKCPLDLRCQREVSVAAVVNSLEHVIAQRNSQTG